MENQSKQTFNEMLSALLRSNRRHGRFVQALVVLAALVAVVVPLSMRQSGVAMTTTETHLSCHYEGNGAHMHNDDCYDAYGNLVCPLPEKPFHTHTADCYATETVLVCGQAETEGHAHTDACYDENGNLTCTLAEVPAHTHTDACYETRTTDQLVCGLEETSEEHVHGSACFETVTVDLPDPEPEAAAEPEVSVAPAAEEDPTPEQELTGTLKAKDENGNEYVVLVVRVEAPQGALPKGSTMTVAHVDLNKKDETNLTVQEKLDEALRKEAGDAAAITQSDAVDITFKDAQGNRIDPAKKVEVRITTSMVRTFSDQRTAGDEAVANNSLLVLHVVDHQHTARTNAPDAELIRDVALTNQDENDHSTGHEDTVLFEAQEFSAYVVARVDGAANAPTVEVQSETEAQPAETTDQPLVEATIDLTAAEDQSEPEQPAAPKAPAQTFSHRFSTASGQDLLVVNVSAPDGAFPLGTTMQVAWVNASQVERAVTKAVSERTDGRVRDLRAVDITFLDADGNEIEPAVPITVTFVSDLIDTADDAHVVHIDDAGRAEVVDSLGADELKSREIADQADELVFESDAFSTYVVAVTTLHKELAASDGATYDITVDAPAEAGIPQDAELRVSEIARGTAGYEDYLFQALQALGEEASANGEASARFFDIKIMSGEAEIQPQAPVKVSVKLADAAGAATASAVHFQHSSEERPEVLDATQDGDVTTFDATGFSVYGVIYTVDFHYDVDGQTYDFSINGGDTLSLRELLVALGVVEAEDAEAFVGQVADVAFSTPELVAVAKVDEDTTAGALKDKLELHPEYSAELTEDEIAAMDAKQLSAGDWALISLKAFDTEETLTITMENCDVYVIRVTDAQAVTDSATFKTSERFVIAYVDNENKYNVLMSDGSYERVDTIEDIDFLDSRHLWRFYYVFTEKDQEAPNANFEYYFIRPVEDLSKSIALIDAADADLIQTGANNVAVIPQNDGTFVMEGYSSAGAPMPFLYFDGTKFLADNNSQTPLTIFTQDDIKKYQFTVRTADPDMGLVYGKDKDGNQQNGVVQFLTRTKDSGNNNWGVEAKAIEESAGGQSRYLFDYFDLNGEVVPASKVTITNGGRNAKITANQLEIPYNGSVLTAHFKQNPNYVGPSKVDSLQDWVNEIRNTNVPLDEEATKKTAEVYDYENRIYRVDLTTRSSLSSFTGTVDLGLILDVSGSMKFPSKLVDAKNASGNVIGTKNVRTINDVIARDWRGNPTRYAWQDWGLSTSNEYYVIAEKSTRATVFRLFYEDGNWWRVDASYGNKDVKSNGTRQAELISSGTKFGLDTDFNYPIYASGDNGADGVPVTRSYYEKKSIDDTASTLNEVLGILNIAANSSQSPNVRAAWNTFSYEIQDHSPDSNNKHSFVSLKDSSTLSINYATSGGTRTDTAVADALNFDWGNSNTKYAIIITDGAPQYGGSQHPSDLNNDLDRETTRLINATKQQIDSLKARGVKVITVGLSMKDVVRGNQLLYDIADTINGKHMFFEAESGDELENALLEVVKTILLPCNVYGDVTDTVSDAFYLVDRETAKPLKPGDKISLDGDLTNDASQPYGIVQADGKTVKWVNQAFTPEGWHGTVYVKAKEDLLGGNMLPTNMGDAVFKAKEYSTSTNPNQRIAITENPSQIVNPEKFHPEQKRETPLVNVNELNFVQNNTEWTVYLGTEVDPKQQMEELWHEILVEEVVKKGSADDLDNDGLPETGKNQSGNTWYPIEANSITDNREPQGSGDKQTFSMNDLFKTLTKDSAYSWWDYSKNEPNWEEFFTQAAASGGITIPYNAYGINDGTNIVVTLTKRIAEGEETDFINHSPHETTVAGNGVEQYTLKVVHTPDYNVLPRGQGGSYTGDIHTGTFGTLYQGHASGTESSENTHVINVFAKKMEIKKVDQLKELITHDSATFVLYRKATAEDTTGKTGVPGLVGEYVAVQTLTTTGGTVTTNPLPLLANNEPYYLVETKAPDGFNTLAEPLKVTIDMTDHNTWTKVADGTTSQTKPDPYELSNWLQEATVKLLKMDNTAYVPDQIVDYNHDNDTTNASVTYQIINDAGAELPEAGGPGTYLHTLCGLALFAAAGFVGIVSRRKESEDAA